MADETRLQEFRRTVEESVTETLRGLLQQSTKHLFGVIKEGIGRHDRELSELREAATRLNLYQTQLAQQLQKIIAGMANSEHVTREIVPLRTSTTPKKPHILLAASGSVAAIKFGHLCRCFSEWAEVKAVATKTALRFIDRNSIPYNIVLYTDENEWSTWRKLGDTVLHIELCSWADMMVIAPLSANTLGKIAGGLCDNLLTCVVRAWDKSKPLFVAPAMNPLMWNNPFTEKQLVLMEDELPIQLIRPENGAMAEPSVIDSVRLFLQKRTAKDGVDV